MRLIDADGLIDEICRAECEKAHADCDYRGGRCESVKAVMDSPTVGGWIPFKIRPLTDEEKEHHPDLIYMFDCPLPDDGDEILVSFMNGTVWVDEWTNDVDECGLASGNDVEEGMAWMPMPEAYRMED